MYSVFVHLRAISPEQAALIVMCDWPEPLFLEEEGLQGPKAPLILNVYTNRTMHKTWSKSSYRTTSRPLHDLCVIKSPDDAHRSILRNLLPILANQHRSWLSLLV